MIGICGAAARTRRATRWVKSGLSIMTSESGRAAMTAPAASRMRRRMRGSRAGMAENPLMASSFSGNRLWRPRSAIAPPPTPANVTGPGSRAAIAAISEAPRRSPDSSPAIRKILIPGGCSVLPDRRSSRAAMPFMPTPPDRGVRPRISRRGRQPRQGVAAQPRWWRPQPQRYRQALPARRA